MLHPEWNGEHIAMDFLEGLPKSIRGMIIIWVIVDRVTKSAHFLPLKKTYGIEKLRQAYLSEIVRLDRVLVLIVSDSGTQFTSQFWKSL